MSCGGETSLLNPPETSADWIRRCRLFGTFRTRRDAPLERDPESKWSAQMLAGFLWLGLRGGTTMTCRGVDAARHRFESNPNSALTFFLTGIRSLKRRLQRQQTYVLFWFLFSNLTSFAKAAAHSHIWPLELVNKTCQQWFIPKHINKGFHWIISTVMVNTVPINIVSVM